MSTYDPATRVVELKRKRGALKASLTCFDNYCNKLPDVFTTQDVNTFELELRVSKLEKSLESFYIIQDEIESLLNADTRDPEASVAIESNERELFESHYFNSIAHGKHILHKIAQSSTPVEVSNFQNVS